MTSFEFPSNQASIHNIESQALPHIVGRQKELSFIQSVVFQEQHTMDTSTLDVFNANYSTINNQPLDKVTGIPNQGGAWVLQGSAGVGKSALIRFFIQSIHSDDNTSLMLTPQQKAALPFDVVWWIPSQSDITVKQSLQHLLDRIDTDGTDVVTDSFPKALEAFLAKQSRWLLVFDGMDEPELSQFFPNSKDGVCLVTSKAFEWDADIHVLGLDKLSVEDCVDLVKASGISADDDTIVSFVSSLQQSPQSIVQALDYIKLHESTLAQYLALSSSGSVEKTI